MNTALFRSSSFRRSSTLRRGSIMKGCLIAGGILLVVLIGIGIFVFLNWKGWAAAGIKAATTESVRVSELPQDQKDRIIARINTVADDFKAGKVSTEQLADVMGQIAQSPVFPLSIAMTTDRKYVASSGLTAEEKSAATRSLQGFARGIAEKSIPYEAADEVIAPISTTQPDGSKQLKDKVTDDELKNFIAGVKSRADKANVPDEPYTINFADEVDKAVDAALKK